MARFVLVLVQANEKLVSSSRKILTPVLLFLQYELNIFVEGISIWRIFLFWIVYYALIYISVFFHKARIITFLKSFYFPAFHSLD